MLHTHSFSWLPQCTLRPQSSSTRHWRTTLPTALYTPRLSTKPSLRISLGSRRNPAAPTATPPHATTTPDTTPTRWQVLRIPGDGRCLFRSLAQGSALQRTGSLLGAQQETAAADALRNDICCKLREQRELISPFIDGDFDQYVATMSHPSTWGGEPELAVAADCVQSQVDVFVPESGGFTKYSRYGEGQYPSDSPPIPLLYYRAGHYDLLIDTHAHPLPRM